MKKYTFEVTGHYGVKATHTVEAYSEDDALERLNAEEILLHSGFENVEWPTVDRISLLTIEDA